MPLARWPLGSVVVSACLMAGFAAGGCGSSDSAGVESRGSYRFDEVRGAFRGVALRDPESRVVARFGPDQGEPAGPNQPLGTSDEDGPPGTFAGSPGTPSPDDRTAALRYRGMSFMTNDRRVYVIMSSLRGTRTLRGGAIGDALDDARRAYRGLKCRRASDAHGSNTFRYCSGRQGRQHFIYFGGDPVGTIAVGQVPLYGG